MSESYNLDIGQRVVDYISQHTEVNSKKITRETSFRELGLDSLDSMKMVFGLERDLNFSFADEDLGSARNVGDLIDHVQKAYKQFSLF